MMNKCFNKVNHVPRSIYPIPFLDSRVPRFSPTDRLARNRMRAVPGSVFYVLGRKALRACMLQIIEHDGSIFICKKQRKVLIAR